MVFPVFETNFVLSFKMNACDDSQIKSWKKSTYILSTQQRDRETRSLIVEWLTGEWFLSRACVVAKLIRNLKFLQNSILPHAKVFLSKTQTLRSDMWFQAQNQHFIQ